MKKIRVRDIRPEGFVVDDAIAPDFIDTREEGTVRFIEPLTVSGKLELSGKEIVSNIRINGKYSTFCYRCLEPVNEIFDKSLVLNFKADKTVEFLDMEEDLRQEILLGLPYRNICNEGCKGLCPDCGINLNLEQCSCKKQSMK